MRGKLRWSAVLRKNSMLFVLFTLSSVGFVSDSLGDVSAGTMSSAQGQLEQCPNWVAGQVVTLTENMTLPSNCTYNKVSFQIKKSDVVFDCNNAILNGTGLSNKKKDFDQYSKETAPVDWAFSITSNEGSPIGNIEIRNCQIRNYVDAIRIKTVLSSQTVNKLKLGVGSLDTENQLRETAPKNIRLSNLSITDSHKHGLYVDRYVNNVLFENSTIYNAGNSGVYLESGTKDITVKNVTFQHNGYSYYDRQNRMSWPRIGILRREAIAIDSSAQNKVINSIFLDNGYGGVFLYKNCYENYKDSTQLPRTQHSDNNQIDNNQFFNEKNGVWLASRQSRDLASFKCGDPLIYKWLSLRFYEDHAEGNSVTNNLFSNVEYGVSVEDDNNYILSNKFTGSAKKDINVGSWVRTLLHNPVKNVMMKDNSRF